MQDFCLPTYCGHFSLELKDHSSSNMNQLSIFSAGAWKFPFQNFFGGLILKSGYGSDFMSESSSDTTSCVKYLELVAKKYQNIVVVVNVQFPEILKNYIFF